MTLLTEDERAFLKDSLEDLYDNRLLKKIILDWVKQNEINEDNYEREIKDQTNDKISNLCKDIHQLELDKMIDNKLIVDASYEYDKFERWYLATLKGYGKSESNVRKNTEIFKYAIISVRKLLAVGIVESLFVN